MENKNKEVLYSTDWFDVVRKDDKTGVEPAFMSVAVLPFTRDKNGLPGKLGVLKEYNRMRSCWGNTVITGRAEGEDPDILAAAQRKLHERSGLEVPDPDRWSYLGFLTTHKMVNQQIPCFACDITDLDLPEEDEERDPDEESEERDERGSEFLLLDVNHALDTDDCFVPALFMRVFKYIFGFAGGNAGPADTEEEKDDRDEILGIEGVHGAGETDGKWFILIEPDSDQVAIESRIREIVGEDADLDIKKSEPAEAQQKSEEQ